MWLRTSQETVPFWLQFWSCMLFCHVLATLKCFLAYSWKELNIPSEIMMISVLLSCWYLFKKKKFPNRWAVCLIALDRNDWCVWESIFQSASQQLWKCERMAENICHVKRVLTLLYLVPIFLYVNCLKCFPVVKTIEVIYGLL